MPGRRGQCHSAAGISDASPRAVRTRISACDAGCSQRPRRGLPRLRPCCSWLRRWAVRSSRRRPTAWQTLWLPQRRCCARCCSERRRQLATCSSCCSSLWPQQARHQQAATPDTSCKALVAAPPAAVVQATCSEAQPPKRTRAPLIRARSAGRGCATSALAPLWVLIHSLISLWSQSGRLATGSHRPPTLLLAACPRAIALSSASPRSLPNLFCLCSRAGRRATRRGRALPPRIQRRLTRLTLLSPPSLGLAASNNPAAGPPPPCCSGTCKSAVSVTHTEVDSRQDEWLEGAMGQRVGG